MRGAIDDLATPHPLGGLLPSIYQENDFAMRFTQAFDSVLAPIQLTLDCQDAYFDADLSPEDMLHWLGSWVGLLLDSEWPIERRRTMVREIVGLYARRGTAEGMQRLVSLYTGAEVELIEGGAVAYSLTPQADLPGTEASAFVVRVRPSDSFPIDMARLEHLVSSSRPAHLPAVVEVVGVS